MENETRVCERCGLAKPLDEFRRRRRANRHGGWARSCAECELEMQGERIFRALAEIRAKRIDRENRHRAERDRRQEKIDAARAVAG